VMLQLTKQKAPFCISLSTSSVVKLCTVEYECKAIYFNQFLKLFLLHDPFCSLICHERHYDKEHMAVNSLNVFNWPENIILEMIHNR
jgi:hypothetical protein